MDGCTWKRRQIKRQIPCPLCDAKVQWVSRHLRTCHKLSAKQVRQQLTSSEVYRRRDTGSHHQRVCCPVPGCGVAVVRFASHIRNKHRSFEAAINEQGTVHSSAVAVACNPNPPSSPTAAVPIHVEHVQNVHPVANERMQDESPNSPLVGQTSAPIPSVADNTLPPLDDILKSFEIHMGSVDGGSKVRPDSYSVAVRQITRCVGGSVDLLSRDSVKNVYVQPLLTSASTASATSIKVKTIRAKLMALEHFCIFLGANFPSLTDIASNLEALEAALPAWHSSLKSKCTVEEVVRRVQDNAESLTPSDVQAYLGCEYAKNAEKLILSETVPDQVSSYDFTRIRNHLLTLLCIGNAHRTGVLIHFSIKDYEDGMKLSSADADSIVFTIAAHKTASTHGAATVAMNKTEAQLLQGYMRFRLLPQFADASAYVFVNTTKTPMTQSNVASALTVAFASSGYADRVNCTKFRKLAVTQIHQKHPEKRHDLASHMCHCVATAEKHYRLMEKKV